MKCVKQFLLFVCLLVCSLSFFTSLDWSECCVAKWWAWHWDERRSANKWIWYFLQIVPKNFFCTLLSHDNCGMKLQWSSSNGVEFCLMFETTRIHQGDWILRLYVSELEVIPTFELILHGTKAENVEQTNSVECWILKAIKQKLKVCFAVALPNPSGDAGKNIMIFFSISESASTVTHSFSFMGNDFS